MGKRTKGEAAAAKAEPLWNDRAAAGGRGTHLGVRWIVAVVIILAAALTIVRGFKPVNQTIVNNPPAVSISTVGEYAASFASDWFTWTDGDTAERNARLRVYNPDLNVAGWNGSGTQRVLTARVFNQEKLSDGQVRVTVRLTIDVSPSPFYVDVLAQEVDGAYGILSIPTPVPAPQLATLNLEGLERPESEPDQVVTNEIRDQLTLFFSAWATGDSTLGPLIADGVKIVPLGGGMTLGKLDNVIVPRLPDGADPDKRTVTANVTWNWPGGEATAPATYSVQIEKSSGKWFIVAVKGGVLNESVVPQTPIAVGAQPTATAAPTTAPEQVAGSQPAVTDPSLADPSQVPNDPGVGD